MDHPEAFCLMQYDSDDGTETEVLWNSRDGVTPFVLTLASGKEGTHARWGDDVRCNESMARALGVRWFSDHTEETARAAAARFVDRFWEHPTTPMHSMWPTREMAVDHFTEEWVGGPTVLDCPGPPEREARQPKFPPPTAGGGRRP